MIAVSRPKAQSEWPINRSQWLCLLVTFALAVPACGDGAGTFTEYSVPEDVGSVVRGRRNGHMALGPDGSVWVSIVGGVGIISPAGATSRLGLPYGTPGGIAAGPDGNMWFTVPSNSTFPGAILPGNRIGRINPNTRGVVDFPVPTDDSDPFGIVAGPDGNLWFTEVSVNQIGRITPEGVVNEFKSPADFPSGITVGPDNNLWFTASQAVGRMDPNGVGSVLMIEDRPGSSITKGSDGAIWFGVTAGHKVGRVRPDWSVTFFDLPNFGNAMGLTTASDGSIWYAGRSGIDDKSGRIGHITPEGAITDFAVPNGARPFDIIEGSDKALWFTQIDSNRIGRFQPP